MGKKKFHLRSFIAFALFISVVWILVSGTVLYIAPPGRVAHWQQWTILGLDKDQWQAQHTLFSYLFIVLAVFHIFTLNWRNLWSYVTIKSHAGFRKSREFFAAMVVIFVVFFATLFNVPPFSSFFDLGESIGFRWEDRQNRGPVPHTENLSLEKIAEEFLETDIAVVMEKLDNKGVRVDHKDQKLTEIAKINELSPAEIYAMISPTSRGKNTGSGSGKGYGRMTIQDLAADLEMDADEIIIILNQNNIQAKKNESIREIADRNQRHPSEILQMIRGSAD